MENRIAILGIIVEDRESSGEVNALLHEYGASIIGRMGLPHYRESCSIITIVMDSTIDKMCIRDRRCIDHGKETI